MPLFAATAVVAPLGPYVIVIETAFVLMPLSIESAAPPEPVPRAHDPAVIDPLVPADHDGPGPRGGVPLNEKIKKS